MTDHVMYDLLLEHMKRFQASHDRIEGRLEEVIGRTGRLETAVASLSADVAHLDTIAAANSVRLDTVDSRLDRIEKRLDLVH